MPESFGVMLTIYMVTIVLIAVVFSAVCAQKLRAQRKALTKESPYNLKLNLVEVVTDPNRNESMLTLELSVTKNSQPQASGYWTAPMNPETIHKVVSELGDSVPFKYDFHSSELPSEKE